MALVMIMDGELSDSMAQVGLAQGHQTVEALGLDGKHESLCEGVQIWTPRRQAQGGRDGDHGVSDVDPQIGP